MNMAYFAILILLFLSSFCKSEDTLTLANPLANGDKLVSKSGDFALGFFPATSSIRSLYLGIWYNNIPVHTVVWVANRDNPITIPSSAMLAITNSSDLALSDSQGRTVWMTQNNNITTGSAAVLLDTGNFVVQLPNGTYIWQSFDHPTDTLMPSMRFVMSYRSQIVGRLVAWKGPDDPASGDFSLSSDPSFPDLQVFIWNGTRPYCRDLWSGLTVSGRKLSNSSSIVYATTLDIGDEFSYMFTTSDDAPFMRITLHHTGKLRALSWNNHSSSWSLIGESPADACDAYASCGLFGYCDFTETIPRCRCLDGFEPDGLNFSGGCRRKEALKCRRQSHFMAVSGMKVPDKFLHVRNKSFDECAAECSGNCSCTAYAYANLSSAGDKADPSRCLVWIGELIDTVKPSSNTGENLYHRLANSGENLYLRLANSPADKSSNSVKIVLPIIASLLLLTCTALGCICKYRVGQRRKKEIQKKLMLGYLSASEGVEDENVEFPFVGFEEILSATDIFSDSNLLGRGGFGNVYKGILEGGKEVAVKRLSKNSGQGIEEFRNEIVLIAKLQHRNLVRLLGCCIHEDEKLLIYEYLPNKSLDAFLFDASRKYVLDWFTRFKIIKGVARGLLYLHQDSRLTIIHRDLKASNILLDAEMIPKISDFGMARIFGGNQQEANTARVVGTYGYMSPEYAMGGVFSVKSDTYSFGVLLLEIVSGLKITSRQLSMNFFSLTTYAWRQWKDGKIIELVDSAMVERCPLHEVLRCIHVGLLCVQDLPNDRPLMSSVMFMLENESAILPAPKQPVFFALSNCEDGEGREIMENSVNAMSVTTLEGR